jgi:hypothetical protein
MRLLTFDATALDPFEIGALLWAVLAFPSPREEENMHRAAVAWCARQVAVTIADDPEHADKWRSAYPDYAHIPENSSKAALRTFRRRTRDRLIAARMARGFFQEAMTGQPAILPDSMKRLSLNELSKLAQRESGESDPHNVEKRAWRESRPVIHLASAFDAIAPKLDGSERREWPHDLQDMAMHRQVVRLAEKHEQIVLSDPRFGAGEEALLRLRWVE